MSDFAAAVLSKLGNIDPDGMADVNRAIADLERKHWLPGEAAELLRWCEFVDPTTDEDEALIRMRIINKRVAERLSNQVE